MKKLLLLVVLLAVAGCATLPEPSANLSRVDVVVARPSAVILAEGGTEAQEPSGWSDGIVRIAQVAGGVLEPWTVPAIVGAEVVQYAVHKAGNAQLLEVQVLTPALRKVLVTLDDTGRPNVTIEAAEPK